MPIGKLLTLVAVFFVTSMISVVTGSASLVTVPVMIQLGIEAHIAVATNMAALIFLSAGGLVPFWKHGFALRRELPLVAALTIGGSIVGALLLTKVPMRSLQLLISAAMIVIAVLSLIRRDAGAMSSDAPDTTHVIAGYVLTLGLAVYGGFFSGGYVTLLTVVFAMFFHMTFVESIAATKLMNLCSSTVAVAIFAWRGMVDFKLGLMLGAVMFVGGALGGAVALKMNAAWLRRVFILVVFALAAKMLYAALSV
jgi:uncharacterized protein